MKTRNRWWIAGCLGVVLLGVAPAGAQTLYSQNFDVDDTANWTFTLGGGTDGLADYFYDYGASAGIPPAPNSGGTTRGMKLQANLTAGVFGGGSASPNGLSLTGDYKVTFDLWSNYIGAVVGGVNPIGTTSGSTMLSTYGIMTSGTFGNRAGSTDAVFFANTGDASSSGFRMYSSERAISYQLPFLNPTTDVDGMGNPIDSHATYAAGTRSTNPASTTAPAGQLYLDTFPPVTVPAAQTTLFPETQFGMTQPGSFGFDWHPVEIAKVGNIITLKMEGVLLGTIDITNYVGAPGGTNIMFGHADVNAGVSVDPYYTQVAFTLIDNVVVTALTPAPDTDFDNDGDTDGADFLIWQKGVGMAGANNAVGDANGDMNVDGADLTAWKNAFPQAPAVGAAGAVPEPATCGLAVAALAALASARRRQTVQ